MANVETTGLVMSVVRTYMAAAAAMKRGYAIVQGADDNHAALAGANAQALGIQQEDTINAGDPLAVVRWGEAVAVIGAAVAAGQYLSTDSLGRLVPVTPGSANVVALAISSGSNAGDFIIVLVTSTPKVASQTSVVYPTVSGAIALSPSVVALGTAGALAETLAVPAAPSNDGLTITAFAITAHAHTITTPANGINGNKHIVTFANVGDTVTLKAVNGEWYVESISGAVLS